MYSFIMSLEIIIIKKKRFWYILLPHWFKLKSWVFEGSVCTWLISKWFHTMATTCFALYRIVFERVWTFPVSSIKQYNRQHVSAARTSFHRGRNELNFCYFYPHILSNSKVRHWQVSLFLCFCWTFSALLSTVSFWYWIKLLFKKVSEDLNFY